MDKNTYENSHGKMAENAYENSHAKMAENAYEDPHGKMGENAYENPHDIFPVPNAAYHTPGNVFFNFDGK